MNCANHPDRERKAFCQNCGKPLCAECARTVGQAVFCEPCLELRLAAANTAATGSSQPFGSGPTAGSATYQAVPGGAAYTYTGTVEGIPYSASGVNPPPGSPNPGIAFLLGFVPGVGAMYNGQYAKGVVHLIVFAVLVSLTDQNGIFGLFVAAWLFYQAFDAYHTARARRDGTPLPNPFGLNDIGERFGFGKSWPATSGPTSFSGSSPISGVAGSAASTPPVQPPPYTPPSDPNFSPFGSVPYSDRVPPTAGPAPTWGAPVDSFSQPIAPVPRCFCRQPFSSRGHHPHRARRALSRRKHSHLCRVALALSPAISSYRSGRLSVRPQHDRHRNQSDR